MKKVFERLKKANIGECIFGFELVDKEYVESKKAILYTLKHIKTKAELIYFDRRDENKTFAICFKTLPENNTGVFHILEHSVLNGSQKFPVKEPFVSLLQSSMQTYLNAMTFSDKTVYPVSSRNEQDFFNLMTVYLDAVFCPKIDEKPEIFMQEGWHYEFEAPDAQPYYNGVVYSEMKGVFANVDAIIEEETNRMLFPDNSYGFISGGHPEHITDLSYEQFIDTHKRFYHPSNARIFLDGCMDVDAVLRYIDGEYLSKYEYRAPDFDFKTQMPRVCEKTVFYEAQDDDALAHMSISKILCRYDEPEKIYGAKILADYLTGSNEAPLKRAFLEKGIAQNVSISIGDGVYQPTVSFVVRNTSECRFAEAKSLLSATCKDLAMRGLDKGALQASLERFSFANRQITEPYGLELCLKALDSWLYGASPLTHIDNEKILDSLRHKVAGNYFEQLLLEMFADGADKSCLYVLPSVSKGKEDAEKEKRKLSAALGAMTEQEKEQILKDFAKMSEWQQSTDDEEALSTLPHLNLSDVPETVMPTKTVQKTIVGREALEVQTETNGIVYLNLFFNASDFSLDELRVLTVMLSCLGELGTQNYSATSLQTEVKAKLGDISSKTVFASSLGDVQHCTPYIAISASMLEENTEAALALIAEILTATRFDAPEKIHEMLLQSDYFLKQALIGGGHAFAVTKALSPFSKEAMLKEALEGESYIRWFTPYVEAFGENSSSAIQMLESLQKKLFAQNRCFVSYSGNIHEDIIAKLLRTLPTVSIGASHLSMETDFASSAIEIPSSVGFSAYGHNLYAMGGEYSGAFAVASSLVSFAYLWNAVRVQGGAYGTGMSIRANGDIFCYSYRDPSLINTLNAYKGVADFIESVAVDSFPLDDIIIGTVNTTDPLLSPAEKCTLEAVRYLKGTTAESIAKIRKEILHTSSADLAKFAVLLRQYTEKAKLCVVGDKESVAFAKGNQ